MKEVTKKDNKVSAKETRFSFKFVDLEITDENYVIYSVEACDKLVNQKWVF